MASTSELGVSKQDKPVRRPVLPSYDTLYREFERGPRPIFNAILNFPMIKGEIHYNPCVTLNSRGEVEYWARFEPDDPYSERSVVRKIEKRKGKSVLSDEIQRAEDPHPSQINENQFTLGVVRTDFNDPTKPEKVSDYREEIFRVINGAVNKSGSVVCRPGEKDVRTNYAGDGESIFVTRERIEEEIGEKEYEIVDSFLQAMVLPSPKTMNDIPISVNTVREDLTSRIDLLQRSKDIWIGANYPFVMKGRNGLVPVGLFSHAGRYIRGKKTPDGDSYRQYVTLASEHFFSSVTGKVIRSGRAKIVSSAADFKQFNISPKKEGLNDVVFMGSPIFIMDDDSLPENVILVEGVNDRAPGISVVKYPFSLPPDPVINRRQIMSKDAAKRYLHSLEQSS